VSIRSRQGSLPIGCSEVRLNVWFVVVPRSGVLVHRPRSCLQGAWSNWRKAFPVGYHNVRPPRHVGCWVKGVGLKGMG